MRRISLYLILSLAGTDLPAQLDGSFAQVAGTHGKGTSDPVSMDFKDGASPGMVEFQLPVGTHRLDLLNSRGRVERILTGQDLQQLDLGSLRAGTWTLRAHTPAGLNVRRFVVMDRGRIAWAVPPPRWKR